MSRRSAFTSVVGESAAFRGEAARGRIAILQDSLVLSGSGSLGSTEQLAQLRELLDGDSNRPVIADDKLFPRFRSPPHLGRARCEDPGQPPIQQAVGRRGDSQVRANA